MKNKALTLIFILIAFLIVFAGSTNLKDSSFSLRESFSSGLVYGYGGGGGPTTYDVESSLDDIGDTVAKSLGKNYGIKFKLGGKSHTIKVKNIYSNSIKLEISSDTFYIDIVVGETKKVDINDNSYYDMAITLKSLSSTKAKVIFEILPDTEKVITVAPKTPTKQKPELAVCEENWQCTEWSECADEKQTRTCTDLNECSTTENKPAEEQGCEAEEGIEEGAVPLTGKAIAQIGEPIAAVWILVGIIAIVIAVAIIWLRRLFHS